MAALIAPAAIFFAAGADVFPPAAQRVGAPVAEAVAPLADSEGQCCVQLVAATPAAFSSGSGGGQSGVSPVPGQLAAASRWRVVDLPRLLPAGVASERGLQVRTILAERSISVAFPEIKHIGGVRPDALPWHPMGLAIDVMIPNPGSAEGVALGNQIVSYVLKNAARFGMQDAIWRGVYYTPSGPSGFGYGHYDHVHVTTTGGGYPTGGEVYAR